MKAKFEDTVDLINWITTYVQSWAKEVAERGKNVLHIGDPYRNEDRIVYDSCMSTEDRA